MRRLLDKHPSSLARHIFVRVAFAVGIAVLSWFLLLDRLFQNQFRNHIKQEVVRLDSQTSRTRAAGEERLRRVLRTLADAEGVAANLDEDLLAETGSDKVATLTLRRSGKTLVTAPRLTEIAEGRQLAEFDGEYYFLTGFRVQDGWVVIGRRWDREMPAGAHWFLLARDSEVIRRAGAPTHETFRACGLGVAECEVSIGGRPHILLRSAANAANTGVEAYLALPVELMTSPLLGMTRGLMAAGALVTILGVLIVTLLTGRAVSKPLNDITASCARVQDSGQVSGIEIPQSRIAEVNAMAKTLQGAVRSIEEGQTKLNQAYFQFMGAIVAMLDARDPYTAGHSHRVSAYSEALARDFGLPPAEVEDIRVAALLHDIGKIGVPDDVLRKHDRLTTDEFEMMKQHPVIGRRILEQVVHFEKYLDAVELHHENLDGTGYPRGLREEQIPIAARIVKVADVFDALSSDRPYRKHTTPEQVQDILRNGSGTHFDGLLVEIFLTRSVPALEATSALRQLHKAVSESGIGVGTPANS